MAKKTRITAPEAKKKQCEVNVGVVGHVDHGKTTLVQSISGEWTDRYSEEIKRGISIKLGYATAVIVKCLKCPPPQCYMTTTMSGGTTCPHCGSEVQFLRKISFVDAPGHEILMATVISGASLMDGAMLVIAANEECPQPQTREHLAALQITGVEKTIIIQNKIELVTEKEGINHYKQIKNFVKGTIAEKAPIIPTSAIFKSNIDLVVQAIEEIIPTPERDTNKPLQMFTARSFDVNKPGTTPEKLAGGVIGGAIVQGKVKVGENIEIKPGIRIEREGETTYQPLVTKVISLKAGNSSLKEAYPGGLIGIGTRMDPSITKADGLVGNVAGAKGTLPPVFDKLVFKVHLMERVVGSKDLLKVKDIKTQENLMINVGAAATRGQVTGLKGDTIQVELRRPVCAETGQRMAISRLVKGRWRLIGWGELKV